MVENIAAIDNAIEALKNKGLVLIIVEGLQDYLSCKIKIPDNKKHTWLGQPHLIKNLESKFGKLATWQLGQQSLESQNSQHPQVSNCEANRRYQEDLNQRLTKIFIGCRYASEPGSTLMA